MTQNGRLRVGIVGVSGYSGMELARLVANHPDFTLALAVSDKWAGDGLGDRLPLGGKAARVIIRPQADASAAFGDLDLAFLCTPAEASLALAGPALDAGARVVDLSGAFRLGMNEYPRWYGFVHPDPALLARACYAIPEACSSADLRQARLVSNPGCYATASTLATLALLRGGVIDKEGIVIDAKSGMTGAGRKATEEMSFSEIDGDFRAYRILRHQHTPEIERALSLAGQGTLRVTFTPYYLPIRRGILTTVYGRLAPGKTAEDVAGAIAAFADGHPFLRAAKPDAVRLSSVVGTNRVLMGGDGDPERGVAIAFAAIDNLVKGAAGQAVQNANLMFGLPQATGLDGLGGTAP
ncbi:MAG TPA: N-acetyl-gamma-glutamyl-phosphate reductase [Polyangia bacterium]|nr:N-acetyl-gamma-glutamyl-phosphate reductase [Polyangia bacterium]